MLHVEQLKQSSLPSEVKILGRKVILFSNWHIIDKKPRVERFLAGLDDNIRGEDKVFKICSSPNILRRRLQDEIKEETHVAAREREKFRLRQSWKLLYNYSIQMWPKKPSPQISRYEGSDAGDDVADSRELKAANAGNTNVDDDVNGAKIVLLLCDEVRMISGSVCGDDFTDKSDWNDAIKYYNLVPRLLFFAEIFLIRNR